MRVAVLDVTGHPMPLLEGLPRVGEQIIDWLAPALPEATYSWYDIEQNGEALPTLDTFDGVIVSGSECRADTSVVGNLHTTWTGGAECKKSMEKCQEKCNTLTNVCSGVVCVLVGRKNFLAEKMTFFPPTEKMSSFHVNLNAVGSRQPVGVRTSELTHFVAIDLKSSNPQPI